MSEFPREGPPDADGAPVGPPENFALMSGGPLFRLLCRTRLCGAGLENAPRRVLAVVLLTWLPLLLLSIVEGHAWGRSVTVPFLRDVETNVRMLIAAPLLILGEVRANRLLSLIAGLFVRNGLISGAARPRFDAAIASAMRLRNSVWAEVGLIAFVYAVGMPFVWRDQLALAADSWYATAVNGRAETWHAGLWLGFVSMPVFQFLLLRWFFRIFIWTRFLVQVSRMGLQLEPTHPDGTAGLLFLARVGRAFTYVGLALGATLSGLIANRILHADATLLQFKPEIAGTAALIVAIVFGPLIAFHPLLRATRREGMVAYGTLGQSYAREFDSRWIRGVRPTNEPLLGSPDIQSLADLHNGFELVRRIRLAPFTMKNVTEFAAASLLPLAPLLLTMFSAEELIERVLKALL